MKVILPVIFNQLEEKNKNILLGLNTDYKYNLYNYGCMFFDLLAAVRYYGKTETVDTFMKKLIDNGGFIKGGLYVHNTLTKLYPELQEKWVATPNLLTDAQMAEIKAALDQGYPVMVKVDYNPSTLPIEEHYLNVVDYNQNDENDMTGADPLGGKLIPMKAYFSWTKYNIRKIIEAYCIISGPIPTQISPSTPSITPTYPVESPKTPEPTVPSNSQPSQAPEKTPTPIEKPEPPSAIQPEKTPTESTVDSAVNAKSDVLASVVDYLEIDKNPEDTTFEDIRRRIAGIKSTSTDYWNKKEAAEKQLVVTAPTIQSLNDTISNLEGELIRMQKAHKAEVEAIESTVQSPRNLKRQFDAIYYDLKAKHDQYFAELVELRKQNMLISRELKQLKDLEVDPVTTMKEDPIVLNSAPPVLKTEFTDRENMISSILRGIKSFFKSDDL